MTERRVPLYSQAFPPVSRGLCWWRDCYVWVAAPPVSEGVASALPAAAAVISALLAWAWAAGAVSCGLQSSPLVSASASPVHMAMATEKWSEEENLLALLKVSLKYLLTSRPALPSLQSLISCQSTQSYTKPLLMYHLWLPSLLSALSQILLPSLPQTSWLQPWTKVSLRSLKPVLLWKIFFSRGTGVGQSANISSSSKWLFVAFVYGGQKQGLMLCQAESSGLRVYCICS